MKLFNANTLTDPGLIALEERVTSIDAYELPDPLYVSPDGSDETGEGTEENPFRQIQYAISKSSYLKGTRIYVSGGSYNSFNCDSKRVSLTLLGNITVITNENKDAGISTTDSVFAINGNGFTVTVDSNNYNKPILDVSRNSCVIVNCGNFIIKNLNCNNINIFYVNLNSFAFMRSSINYEGSPNISGYLVNLFYASHGSRFSWSDFTNDTNVGNMNKGSSQYFRFAATLGASHIALSNEKINIGSGYTHGLYAAEGFISALIGNNNAEIPMAQANGGRIFTGSSTNTTNSISPSPQILDIGFEKPPQENFLNNV